MVWPVSPRPSETVFTALKYSDHFDYPLSLHELWFWQPFTRFSPRLFSSWPYRKSEYYFLKNRSSIVGIRQSRTVSSQKKLLKAGMVSRILKIIPSVQAIFITGSLAMQNCPPDDDIDILLIVSPHTLWITRVLIVAILKALKWRRPPYLNFHSSPVVRDKICDNLYLDLNHLHIPHLPINQLLINQSANFYLAHEILQAKCIFDRGGIHHQFLTVNSWTAKYLPIAYREILKQIPQQTNGYKIKAKSIDFLLIVANFLLFTLQYLYMRPHLSSEKIALGYAFFHPNNSMILLPGHGKKN
jgi:hypothetical protein